MKRTIISLVFAAVLALAAAERASAQHVLSVTGGAGLSTARMYPAQENRVIWGTATAGVSWRHYTKERFLGGFGIDLEWLQRGFCFAPDSWRYDDKSQYKYYTRRINTIMLPIVWQPHAYMFKRRVRFYLEAAVTFHYNFASTYDNELYETSGDYEFRSVRDNRFGYGLAAGAGLDVLIKQIEIGIRARYYFGYSDILRNRNKYYDNRLDQLNKPGENPFSLSPLRSPLDNVNIVLRVGFRFNKNGFDEWYVKRQKRDKKQVLKFAL